MPSGPTPSAAPARAVPVPGTSPETPGSPSNAPQDLASPSGRADLLALWLPFAVAVVLTWASSPDDAFISLRYAHNLLSGHGLVFNPGQRVDGVSSPAGLFVALLALTIPVGSALFKAKLVTLAFACLAVSRARRLVRCLALPRRLELAGLPLVGASPMIAFAAANALATAVGCFATTGLLVELCSGRAFRRPRFAAAFAVLVVLSHPEGPLLVAALAGWALLVQRTETLWRRVSWVVASALTEVFLLAASQVYFGSPVPNTYFAKQVPLARALPEGLRYLLSGVDVSALSPFGPLEHLGTIAVLLLDLLIGVGFVSALASRGTAGYLAAAVAAQGVFVLAAGGDRMDGARFLAPVAVALAGLTLIGSTEVAGVVPSRFGSGRQAAAARIATGLVTASLAATSLLYLLPSVHDPVWRLTGIRDRQLVAAGGYGGLSRVWATMPSLLACAPRGSLVATTEAGYGPFVNESLRVLDLRGLTDRDIATNAPGAMKVTSGVADEGWETPDSLVGRIILSTGPTLVATLDGQPAAEVLDRHYLLMGSAEVVGSSFRPAVLSVYRAVGRRLVCTPQEIQALLRQVGSPVPVAAHTAGPG